MFTRHFFHEFRTAARDTAGVAAIPVALTLATFLLWNAPWSGSDFLTRVAATTTGWQVAGFMNGNWCYFGWLIPWWLLRQPGLRDENAAWRSAPVGKWTLFGARLFWAFVTTVALPVATAWIFLRCVEPVLATDQTVNILWIQFTLFCAGAFAAFVAKGNRGVWLVAGLGIVWFITNLVGEDAMKWILRRWVLGINPSGQSRFPQESAYTGLATTLSTGTTWPALVAWVLIPVLVSLWLPFAIRFSGKRTRWWAWIPFCFLVATLSQASLFLSPYRRPDYPAETLPVMRVAMKGSVIARQTFQLGATEATLPAGDLQVGADGEYWGPYGFGYGSNAMLSGEWTCDGLRGVFSPQLAEARTNLHIDWREGDAGKIPTKKSDYGDKTPYGFPNLARPLKITLGAPGIRLWTATGAGNWQGRSSESNPVFQWVDSDSFGLKPALLKLAFDIPQIPDSKANDWKPVMDPAVFKGKTVSIHARMILSRMTPPTVIGRVPYLRGGELKTPLGWTLRIPPALPDDKVFPVAYLRRAGPVEPRPRLSENWFREPPEVFQLLLFNAREKQAILLVTSSSGELIYNLPERMPKLPPDWFDNAEIVMLKHDKTPVTLPLEVTLQMPKQK